MNPGDYAVEPSRCLFFSSLMGRQGVPRCGSSGCDWSSSPRPFGSTPFRSVGSADMQESELSSRVTTSAILTLQKAPRRPYRSKLSTHCGGRGLQLDRAAVREDRGNHSFVNAGSLALRFRRLNSSEHATRVTSWRCHETHLLPRASSCRSNEDAIRSNVGLLTER